MPLPVNAEVRVRGALAGFPIGAIVGILLAFATNDRSGIVFVGMLAAVVVIGIVLPYVTIAILQALGRAIASSILGR